MSAFLATPRSRVLHVAESRPPAGWVSTCRAIRGVWDDASDLTLGVVDWFGKPTGQRASLYFNDENVPRKPVCRRCRAAAVRLVDDIHQVDQNAELAP